MALYSRKAFTLVEIMIVLTIIAIALAIALPNYLKLGNTSKKTVCINNLKKIDGAIDQWAVDKGISAGVHPSAQQEDEIYSYIKGGKPKCPAGGIYAIYTVGTEPQVRCSLEGDGHKLIE